VIFVAGWLFFLRPAPSLTTDLASPRIGQSGTTVAPPGGDAELPRQRVMLIDDDGQTLWKSPTDGPPLETAYLPPGSQIIIAIRWGELFQHEDVVKLKNAISPLLTRGMELLDSGLDIPLGIKKPPFPSRILIGLQFDAPGELSMTRVVYQNKDKVPWWNELKEVLAAHGTSDHGAHSYGIKGELAYYFPDSPRNDRVVVAPKTAITDILDLGGEPPPLRRDMERLLAHTDADRLVTMVFTSNALFGEGSSISTNPLSRLRQSLFWFLGDEFSAASVSLHWDDDFYVEMIAVPILDTPPERAARILSHRWTEVPEKVGRYVASLRPHPYGSKVLARLPSMLRMMVAYTRSGVEQNNVVLRSYLPAKAGHNLLTAAVLALAEVPPTYHGTTNQANLHAHAKAGGINVRERLQARTSLRFARDTLEAALEQLAQDIGVTIRIRGADLQAEGITKNQSFSIDMEDKTAHEILVAILRLANPDKAATGATDEHQKLVYVISRSDPDAEEEIIVTTRAAAMARGEELPAAFIAK